MCLLLSTIFLCLSDRIFIILCQAAYFCCVYNLTFFVHSLSVHVTYFDCVCGHSVFEILHLFSNFHNLWFVFVGMIQWFVHYHLSCHKLSKTFFPSFPSNLLDLTFSICECILIGGLSPFLFWPELYRTKYFVYFFVVHLFIVVNKNVPKTMCIHHWRLITLRV